MAHFDETLTNTTLSALHTQTREAPLPASARATAAEASSAESAAATKAAATG